MIQEIEGKLDKTKSIVENFKIAAIAAKDHWLAPDEITCYYYGCNQGCEKRLTEPYCNKYCHVFEPHDTKCKCGERKATF